MCQNNRENCGSVPAYHSFHHPHCSPSQLPKHALTYQHYQRRLAKVAISELNSYCILLEGRINNRNPYVCNVAAFQVLPQRQIQYEHSRQVKQIFVWTDRMVPLTGSDWTTENIAKLLLGFKRLDMIYGHFGIGFGQICKNLNGEIKVWISATPDKCTIDHPLSSEKDMLRAVAIIVQKSNSELAFKINAARTIRQAIQSLNSTLIYSSPLKQQRMSDFSDFKQKKNLSSTFTAFQTNKLNQNLASKNKSFANYSKFPQSTKNNLKQKPFFPNYKSNLNSTTMSRPQSQIYPPFVKQVLINSKEYSIPNNFSQFPKESTTPNLGPHHSNQQSVLNSRHFTFDPINRFASNSTAQPFSQRLGSQRQLENDGEPNSHINNFDITIINNNVSNYISHFTKNKSSRASRYPLSKSPASLDPKKVKSHGKASQNASFWMNSSKLSKNQPNVPYYFAHKQKPQSLHQQYAGDSLEESVPQFTRNTTESLKFDNFQAQSNGRKIKKLYTFCNPKNDKNKPLQKKQMILSSKESTSIINKSNFFKKMTPSNFYYRNNTTQFFPSKKNNNQNKSFNVQPSEARQKRFNSFAANIPQQQQFSQKFPTTKSVRIDQNNSSTSSKKIELKKQLKMEFGNLFNIAEVNQSPRCSYSQKTNKGPLFVSESKTDLIKQSILKEKIKQKNEAFAELKKEALKVLTDL